jgi:hypothetical protein
MSRLIRVALVAALALAAAPAAMAQCIVNPNIIGSPCAGNIGSPAIINGQRPVFQEITPPPQPQPYQPLQIPSPRQAESLSRKAPTNPLLPLPSAGAAQRCVTMYGSCPIPGGAIPSGACSCGSTTGTAR